MPETVAAPAGAKQRSVHCPAMIARKINDKNSDMDYHAVLPPGYRAGGDSEREDLRQQEPEQLTIMATGTASSSGRPEAIRFSFSCGEGEVHLQTNTDG